MTAEWQLYNLAEHLLAANFELLNYTTETP